MWWIIGILVVYSLIWASGNKGEAKGCLKVVGGILVCLFVGLFAIAKFEAWSERRDILLAKKAEIEQKRQEEEQKRQKEERLAREQEELRQKQENREGKLRDFALKEAPKVWETYQSLDGDIKMQDQKIAELRKTLEVFGRSADEDVDYKRIVAMRDEMIRSRKVLHTKLEDLYLAARKYEAAPNRKDYQELHRKALEDGIREAEAASARFREMRLSK